MSNFKGSELEKSIITNNEIIFFKSALKLINSKIKKLDKIKI